MSVCQLGASRTRLENGMMACAVVSLLFVMVESEWLWFIVDEAASSSASQEPPLNIGFVICKSLLSLATLVLLGLLIQRYSNAAHATPLAWLQMVH